MKLKLDLQQLQGEVKGLDLSLVPKGELGSKPVFPGPEGPFVCSATAWQRVALLPLVASSRQDFPARGSAACPPQMRFSWLGD